MRLRILVALLFAGRAAATMEKPVVESIIDYCVSSRWGYSCFRPGARALIDLSGGRLAHAVVRPTPHDRDQQSAVALGLSAWACLACRQLLAGQRRAARCLSAVYGLRARSRGMCSSCTIRKSYTPPLATRHLLRNPKRPRRVRRPSCVVRRRRGQRRVRRRRAGDGSVCCVHER